MSRIQKTNNQIVDLRAKKIPQKNDQIVKQKPKSNWLDFIKYNNAFLIVLIIGIIAFSGLAAASEDVRNATIGGKQVYAEGVDNTMLLETDLDGFNMDFKIMGIVEDEESYIVTYSYMDLDLVDSAWQYVEKEVSRKINKPFRKDLGVYLAEELSEEANARVKELKYLQKQAQEEGEMKIVQVTEYSGLIGKILDASAVVFPGYEPIKKIELEAPEIREDVLNRVSSGSDDLVEVYTEWVEEHPQEFFELNREEIDASVASTTEQIITDSTDDGTDNTDVDADSTDDGTDNTDVDADSTDDGTDNTDTGAVDPEPVLEPEGSEDEIIE